MDEKIIFIYCICSDLAKSIGLQNDPQCKMNSAEVMTVAIVAALLGEIFTSKRYAEKPQLYTQYVERKSFE